MWDGLRWYAHSIQEADRMARLTTIKVKAIKNPGRYGDGGLTLGARFAVAQIGLTLGEVANRGPT